MENFKNSPIVKKLGFNRIILCGVLVLMYMLFSIVEPSFVSYSRIISALNYAYFLGFLALGVTFVIATGEIDFSIGPVMFCAALIAWKTLIVDGVPMGACSYHHAFWWALYLDFSAAFWWLIWDCRPLFPPWPS